MEDFVIGFSAIASALLFAAALIDLALTWKPKAAAQKAVAGAAVTSQTIVDSEAGLKEHAGVDLKGNWEALAALAVALKDLDRSTRLFTLSLAFLAVAGTTLGLTEIAEGIGAS